MFIFRTFKSVRICVSLKLSKTLLFFGLKIANFCLKKRIIGYTHTPAKKKKKKKKKFVLSFSVIGCGLIQIYPSKEVFLHRERYAVWVFFVRVVIAFHSWSSLRVALALFLGMRIGNCVTHPLYYSIKNLLSSFDARFR